MSFLRNSIEKLRKLYVEPGSRFHKVWPAFEALETFLFSPAHVAPKHGPHVRDAIDLKRAMTHVIIAMLPCLLWAIYNTGHQHFLALGSIGEGGAYLAGWLQSVFPPDATAPGLFDKVIFGLQRMLPILVVSYGVGLGIEVLFSIVRKEEVSEGYLVSGMLIALIVPASIPLWQLAVAVTLAVVLGKEVCGGTGMNVFNPAMLVRACLFVAFAAQNSGYAVWCGGNNAGHVIVVIGPYHSERLFSEGWTKEDVRAVLFENVRRSVRELRSAEHVRRRIEERDFPVWVNLDDDDALVPLVNSPEQFVVMVTPGENAQSSVIPTWSLSSLPVARPVGT